ncbi:MAG: DUF3052 domain-containing protein [Chloroflexi bacterium SZAS-1]|jgi:uncharacterized membrane protein|nr:DUF3052 domain-containing protein [Chloroflexi bacterium SZAS-1]
MTGYSGKPLVVKLGIKPGCRLAVVDAPPNYAELVAPLPAGVLVTQHANTGPYDCIHLFATSFAVLDAQLPRLKVQIVANGMIWVSWPKRAAKVATDITEGAIRGLALAQGLVDVKVCAVDAIWSGLKLVIPLAARKPAADST